MSVCSERSSSRLKSEEGGEQRERKERKLEGKTRDFLSHLEETKENIEMKISCSDQYLKSVFKMSIYSIK